MHPTIETRLTGTYRRLGLHAVPVPAHDWHLAGLPAAFRFGWLPPVSTAGSARTAFFSPELLEATTAHLPAADLDRYLAVIETTARVACDAPGGTDPLTFIRFVEDRLYDTALGPALTAATHLELRAADLGIIPTPAPPLPDDPDERRRQLDDLFTGEFAGIAHGYATRRPDWLADHPAGLTPIDRRDTFEYHPARILATTDHLDGEGFELYLDALADWLLARPHTGTSAAILDIDPATALTLTGVALHHHHTPATFFP
jgi:hypothetical protein